MQPWETYVLYGTLFCLLVNFVTGKLRLLSIVWLYYFQRKATGPLPGISVVICTRNDLEALQNHLLLFLDQDYPEFEVIVVDDASDDGTWDYLISQQENYSQLKAIRINEKDSPGKKQALAKGISEAKYAHLLVSDADCAPVSKEWIHSHAAYFQPEPTVILGYGKYRKTRGFLNLLQRFDTATIAMQYMSRALWKYPYMGVGRNMGYSRDLGSFQAALPTSLASGDDDLFIQAIRHKARFVINAEKESFTVSDAKPTWKAWLTQKGRHTTTAPSYSFFTKVWLMQTWLTSFLFYLGIFIILLTGNWGTALMLYFLNALCNVLFNSLWMSKLAEKDLILLSPILDFIYIFVQPVFVIKSLGRKKEKWN